MVRALLCNVQPSTSSLVLAAVACAPSSYAVGDHTAKSVSWWLGLDFNSQSVSILTTSPATTLEVPPLPQDVTGITTVAAVATNAAGVSGVAVAQVQDRYVVGCGGVWCGVAVGSGSVFFTCHYHLFPHPLWRDAL